MKIERPNIFTFYDPIHFLNEWVRFLKNSMNQFNLNLLSKKSGLSISNISMILNKQRPLTEKSFQKLVSFLHLNRDEKEYLNHLRIIDQSEEQFVRIDSLNKVIKIAKKNSIDTHDLKIFEYLTSWHKVAIYELVNLTEFQLDSHWIQQRLIRRISLADIEDSINFLKVHKFIGQNEDGKWIQLKQDLNCQGGIYRLSLSEFHRQIFDLAHSSIESVPRQDRLIMGQTMALSDQDFENLKLIIQETITKMNSVNKNRTDKTSVYHIEIATFPMIINKSEPKDDNEK